MSTSIDSFITRWAASGAAERANKDSFLRDLCDVLDVPHPNPTTGDSELDTYVFERDALFPREGGTATVGKVDLYKHDCFILEAKQGSGAGAKKLGTAKRETPAWNVAMKDAYGQAVGYARAFDKPVPFLVVADLGYCFDLYAAFDGTWDYRPFPSAQSSRLFLKDLGVHRDTLRQVFLAPRELDPAKHSAKVTREIAGYLANLAKKLEADKHPAEAIATFLMRCLFTMFAEDVGLLPADAFTKALRDYWIPNPASFAGGVESLWRTMNEGGHLFGVVGKILKFNGGLFASPSALALDAHALRLLLVAAECNWAEVEPAIFGTLLERALDPKERHKLGAHYTPRAYVERLVRPTIEEPLRADWDVVQAQVRKLVGDAHGAKSDREAKKKTKEAAALVRAFHQKLVTTRVLDPACGSGNFLYVTLDLFKRLEGEVLASLEGLGEKQELLHMEDVRVTPQQFRGIEVKRWAKEIAELVLWIGYLQWHFRLYGKNLPVPEPVLRDYKNIECRDAVLTFDEPELVRDDAGKPESRWDGETMKRNPATGEAVPDESARAPIYRYPNARQAQWPTADFIVGNPPYIGTRRIRTTLGHEYVSALRAAYPEVDETADLVMYWWSQAAHAVTKSETRRFGFITTNSITQQYSAPVVQRALDDGLRLVFAIPDHPWVDEKDGAAVRVTMTVGEKASAGSISRLGTAIGDGEDVRITETTGEGLTPKLTFGANTTGTVALQANAGMCFQGVVPAGEGFKLEAAEVARRYSVGPLPSVVRPYVIGRDLVQRKEDRYIIDFFDHSERQAREAFPELYQRLFERVHPERQQNARKAYRDKWWIFAEPRPAMRRALKGLQRFIVTPYTAKFRPFMFVEGTTVPDAMAYCIASDDALLLGILSSRVHVSWALASGGRLGVGNDPRYNSKRTFYPFPFPAFSPSDSAADGHRSRIRELGEALDAHRKARQAVHPMLTVTAMYNALQKLRAGEAFTPKDKATNEQGLVSVLMKLHDDLDEAVLAAYGWEPSISEAEMLERLVVLNQQRADEEARGTVRWLRADLQASELGSEQRELPEIDDVLGSPDAAVRAQKMALAIWPKKLAEQIGCVRDLVTRSADEWSADGVAASFRNSKMSEVVDVLDSLAALGLLLTYELLDGRRWRSAAFLSARPPPMA